MTDAYWERRSGYHYLKHDKGTDGEIARPSRCRLFKLPAPVPQRLSLQ